MFQRTTMKSFHFSGPNAWRCSIPSTHSPSTLTPNLVNRHPQGRTSTNTNPQRPSLAKPISRVSLLSHFHHLLLSSNGFLRTERMCGFQSFGVRHDSFSSASSSVVKPHPPSSSSTKTPSNLPPRSTSLSEKKRDDSSALFEKILNPKVS